MARKIFKSRREIVVTVLVLAGLAWLLDAWLTAPPPNWRDACGAGSGRVVDEAVCAYRTDPAFRKTVDLAAAGTPAKTDADRVATWMRAADDDPYRDMDGGATRDPAALMRDLAAFVPGITAEEARRAAVVGRNNWVVWTAGNDRFWDVLANRSFGNLDLLKVISNAPNLRFNRDNRWKYLGLVNEPCFRKPTGPRRDRFGLWLDERDPNCPADPFENQEKYPGVKIGARGKTVDVGSLYGWGTGIVGLRLFPNPDFDEAAAAKWDWFRYYNDPTYYTDRNLVRPYRVGMSCGFCHVGPSPTNPPADPNAPEWSNLSSNPGAQYFWVDRIFAWDADKANYVYQLFHTSRPGALDTSLVSSDYINNPRTMNAVYSLPARMKLALSFAKERLAGPELDNRQISEYVPAGSPLKKFYEKPDVWSPRVLKDGSDSVGALGALNRVYVNIGLFGDEWITHFNPIVGGTGISPIRIATGRANSAYWVANESQTPNLALFFLATAKPDRLAAAPGGADHLTKDPARLAHGRDVFAETCAGCHSSKLPKKAQETFAADACMGPGYLDCWNRYWTWVRSDEFKREMKAIAAAPDFLDDNFLSTDLRVPVTLLETQACSPLATNAIADNIWNDFAASTYKALPSVGKFAVHDPYTGAKRADVVLPGGGRGFTRPASLISLWSTAPFLLNNALGPFDPSPSVEARLKVFDASIEQLLWPEKRGGDVTYRTASGGLLRGQVDVLPENAYLNVPESNLPGWAVSVVNLLTGDRYAAGKGLRIGPIPAGTPVNLIAGIDLDTRPGFFADLAHKARLLGLALKLNATFAKITPQTSADEARQIFRDDVAADLIAADKCSDYIVNRGHYFGTRFFADPSGAPAAGLSDEEKRDLIEFLKTL